VFAAVMRWCAARQSGSSMIRRSGRSTVTSFSPRSFFLPSGVQRLRVRPYIGFPRYSSRPRMALMPEALFFSGFG
jgi:hypothetical protein